MVSLSADGISLADFQKVLSRYEALIHSLSKPSGNGSDTLEQLDEFRLSNVPVRLQKARETGTELYLKKEEAVRLIRWKLKHGKFRPRLEQLVASNSVPEIETVTREAFALLSSVTPSEADILSALNKLTLLKGIGPASASLLLAVCRPDSIPFFSDEAFRWVMTGVDYAGNSGGKGWDRKIKYDKKEYGEFIKRVRSLIVRLGGEIEAVDVERVGWVLGRERAAIVVDANTEDPSSSAKTEKKTPSVKRKAAETEKTAVGPGGDVRRSKRARK